MQDLDIKYYQEQLTPKNFSNFEEFDKYQKEHSYFSHCCKRDSPIFFHCDDCCMTCNGVYCLYCFNKTDHENHQISVLYEPLAFCDCGDPKTIKKECWCPNHGFKDLNTYFPYEKDFFLDVICNICQNLIDYPVIYISNGHIFDFLYNITEWGSLYIDIISEVLFKGNWKQSFYGQIFEKYIYYQEEDIDRFHHLFNRLLVSPNFKRGYMKFVNETFETLKLIYKNENFPDIYMKIVDFTFQCLHDGNLMIEFQKIDSTFTKIVDSFTEIYTFPQFKLNEKFVISPEINDELHSTFSQIINYAFSNPLMFKFIIKQPDFMNSYMKLISINSENAIIKRKSGDKIEYNNDIHFYQTNNYFNINFCSNIFASMLPIITIEFDNDINNEEVFNLPTQFINDSHIMILNSIFLVFAENLDKFLSFEKVTTSFNTRSFVIQPYFDEFVIDHPLAKLFISSAFCFSFFNSTDPLLIFERVGFKKFDQLLAIFASCESAKFQILNDLFSKNDDSINRLAFYYDDLTLSCISQLQSVISLKSKINEDSIGEIVIMIAESFGIEIWEKLSINEIVDCHKWTNVITSLLLLLIQLSCNENFFNFRLNVEKMKKIVIDLVYCGRNNMKNLQERAVSFTYNRLLINKAIEAVVDIRADDQGSHFTLKPEFFDTSSVFSSNFKFNEFNKMLAYEITNNKGRLLRLNPIDPPSTFSGLKNYLQTNELKIVIERILKTMYSCTDKFSVSCMHTLFSLFRLVLIDSENFEKTEELYVNSEIIPLMIKLMKKLENGDLYLKNFVENECKEKYSKISAMIEKEIIEKVEMKKKKPDKSKILSQFLNQQNDFASKNKEELNTVEKSSPSSFTCAFCGEPFDSKSSYGIIVHLFNSFILNNIESVISNDQINRYPISVQIRSCGHWCHSDCFFDSIQENVDFLNDKKGIQCPFDRTYSNAFIPVFQSDKPDEKCIKNINTLASKILFICNLSLQQCLAYNIALTEVLNRHNPKFIDDKRTTLCLIHLLRACFFVDDDINVPIHDTSDLLVEFTIDLCSCKNLQEAKASFESKVQNFWHQLVNQSNVSDKQKQISMIETYVRRVSLLEKLTFASDSDSDSIILPTVDDFIEIHHLNSIEEEIQKNEIVLKDFSILSPCKKFVFQNLKKNFIDYILDYDIISNNKTKNINFGICLLCGKLYKVNCFESDIFLDSDDHCKVEDFNQHSLNCFHNISSLILMITGSLASSVLFYDGSLGYFSWGSIYTDKYGDENIGVKQGNILVLNQSRVSRLFDDFITGEIRRRYELKIYGAFE